jgi:hypothetical protein
MIRTEVQPAETTLAEAAQAIRILHSSTGGLDSKTPIALSGSLFLPRGEAPAMGRPLIAWAHGTVGNGSLGDSTPFVKKAFAGETIAGNCARAG